MVAEHISGSIPMSRDRLTSDGRHVVHTALNIPVGAAIISGNEHFCSCGAGSPSARIFALSGSIA